MSDVQHSIEAMARTYNVSITRFATAGPVFDLQGTLEIVGVKLVHSMTDMLVDSFLPGLTASRK